MLIQHLPKQLRVFLGALLIFSLSPAVMAYSLACERASDLNDDAYKLYQQGAPEAELKRLLNQALQRCPSHPEAHNNLADLLRKEGEYSQAISHYRQAVQVRRDFPEAWYGLGETYYQQRQFPLSLEAHLHACKTDADSKARLKELLKDNRYAITEENQILNKDSLLLLFDKQRRAEINQMLAACGFKARIRHTIIFRGLVFKPGNATLKESARLQLEKIADALKFIKPSVIKVHGHTDNQRWKRCSRKRSDELNLRLSQRRANTVKNGLVAQDIPQTHIQAQGHGSQKQLVPGNSKAAQSKNRRVEIEVK